MASPSELAWHRIDKFGGLWDKRPRSLMPPNAAQVMSGCHPQPTGGLRAFFRPRAWSTTEGLSRGAGVAWRVAGVYPSEQQAFILTAPVDTTKVTDAVRPPKGTPQVRITDNASATWRALAGGTTISGDVTGLTFPVYAQQMGVITPEASYGNNLTVLHNVTGEGGLYEFDESGETFNLRESGGNWAFVSKHQSRILAAYGPSLAFTSPGTTDFPAGAAPDQFINFAGRPVAWILPIPPNDLLVGLRDGSIFNIQGALDDPTIRTLKAPDTGSGGDANLVSGAVFTQAGPVALSASLGPIVVSLDGLITPIAPGLEDDHWRTFWRAGGSEGGMTMAYSDGFLFVRSDGLYQQELDRRIRQLTTGDPDGRIRGNYADGTETWPTDLQDWVADHELDLNGMLAFDFESKAWFRSAHPDVVDWKMPWHVAFNQGQESMWEQGTVLGFPTKEHTDVAEPLAYGHQPFGPRQHTWEWTSAPFHHDDGRQVKLREVQFGAYGHTATGVPEAPSTIVVTATNEHGETTTPYTVQVVPGVSQVYTLPIRCDGTYVDVTLKAVSSDGTYVEAPTLEFLNLGFSSGPVDRQKGTS